MSNIHQLLPWWWLPEWTHSHIWHSEWRPWCPGSREQLGVTIPKSSLADREILLDWNWRNVMGTLAKTSDSSNLTILPPNVIYVRQLTPHNSSNSKSIFSIALSPCRHDCSISRKRMSPTLNTHVPSVLYHNDSPSMIMISFGTCCVFRVHWIVDRAFGATIQVRWPQISVSIAVVNKSGATRMGRCES